MNFTAFLRQNAPYLSVGALLTFSSSFGQTYFISIFSGVIRTEFGLSHGGWGAIYSTGTMVSALVMIWAGALTDRFRVRSLSLFVLGGLALSSLLMSVVSAVWALPFVIFALRLTGQGMSSHIATVAMARWYVAMRGRALAIASLGFAAGEALLPVIFVALMAYMPWRILWVLAAVLALTALPAIHALLKRERTPQSIAAETQSAGMAGRHWTRRDVIGHWLFWLVMPSVLGPSAFVTAFFFQQVHLAEVKGWAHLDLVALFPVYTLAGIGSLLISGIAADRFGAGRLMPIFQLPLAAAFLLMSQTETLTGAAIGMVLMAVSVGANSTLPGAFWAEFYGTRYLGGIKALATAAMVFGSALGPGLTGFLIDKGVDFPDQMSSIAVYFLISSILVAVGIARAGSLRPPSL